MERRGPDEKDLSREDKEIELNDRDLWTLATRVYQLLHQDLRIERERQGRYPLERRV
jgi:hypothetical protein